MEIWPTKEKGLSEVDAYSSRAFHVCRTPLLLPQVSNWSLKDLKGSGFGMWACTVNRTHMDFKSKLSLIPFGQLALASYHLPIVGCELKRLSSRYRILLLLLGSEFTETNKISEETMDLCIIKYHTHCVQKIQVQGRMKQSIFTYLHSIHGPTISLHDSASLFKVSWAWWHLAIKCQARHVFHVPCRSGF